MAVQRRLSETEWLLLTTPDDSEEAPWMVMPDVQWRIIALLMSILRLHVQRHGLRWYLAAELKIVMPRKISRRTLDLAPDLLMAAAEDQERAAWHVRKEGGPPLLVLEVVTKESWVRDTQEKPLLYEQMGVREYVICAPQRTDGGPWLFGYHRDKENRWVPWSADAEGVLWSTALGGLGLYVEEDGGSKRLRVRDQEGRRLPSAEEEAARAEQEAARADREAAARQEAEAELARLRALLRSQQGQ